MAATGGMKKQRNHAGSSIAAAKIIAAAVARGERLDERGDKPYRQAYSMKPWRIERGVSEIMTLSSNNR